MRGVIFYPCIGNKAYPYTNWAYWYREYAWETLGVLSETYHNWYRYLRERYKWSPDVVDKLELNRLMRIYEEAVHDQPRYGDEDD